MTLSRSDGEEIGPRASFVNELHRPYAFPATQERAPGARGRSAGRAPTGASSALSESPGEARAQRRDAE